MDGFLKRFLLSSNDHLSEEQTVGWICRELSFTEKLITDRHLARCWQCRLRKDDLEGPRADRIMCLYRAQIKSERLYLAKGPRELFMERLRLQMQAQATRTSWRSRLPRLPFLRLWSLTNPQTASVVLCTISAVCVGIFWHQRSFDITSNSLLVRAELWDTPSLSQSRGVVFQSIRITTGHQTMMRSIYRDTQAKRRKRPVKLTAPEDQLRTTLITAGLDWDEPLSASGFQEWHDHQRIREDKIVRAGKHLLRLTTTVPDGAVSEQSLTVRDTDFHAVERTVAVRNQGTVEIAELEFKILPWSAVDATAFEPLEGDQTPLMLTTGSAGLVLRVPEKLSDAALDETELSARLILNQLQADTGEQIEIERTAEGVDVKGFVETEERKNKLQTQLRTVRHLQVSIQTLNDVKSMPIAGSAVSETATSMPDQPSPLGVYLRSMGQDVNAVNGLARRLFESARAISLESRAINELQTRFNPEEQASVIASATSVQLIHSHRERLVAALRREREVLAEIPGQRPDDARTSSAEESLQNATAENLHLCKELTRTDSAATRSAEEIVADISRVAEHLEMKLHETSAKLKSPPITNGNQ